MSHARITHALRERVRRSVRPLDDAPGAAPPAAMFDLPGSTPRRRAAVLLALIDRGDDLTVLFTRRNEQLSQHAGQVSFPGGGIEAHDADALAAALRETHEEIGVGADLLEPIGYLDAVETLSSYRITPVVAWLDAAYRAVPDPREVAEVFEVPLAFFLDPANRRTLQMQHEGRMREIHEFFYADQRIWGATAAMLLNLIRRMEIRA
jgi:8-oxo-dGTP pyrophosphatase MutT (NUDIX family)